MGTVSEDTQDLVFHHCQFPTATRRDTESLHNKSSYGSISVFEHDAALPGHLSTIEATKDLLQAAWASLLCSYTRNEIVAFVANTGNQKTSHTNGICPVEAADAGVVEFQTLNKKYPREIHRVPLERYASRGLRNAQVNTAIDFSGALSMSNGREKRSLFKLLEDQHVDFAEIVSPFPLKPKRDLARMHCICRTIPCASARNCIQ